MRQPGADDDQRQRRLRDLVTGRAERRDVVGRRSCISSMNTATPSPTSAASPPTSVSSSTRSISMSPESARPTAAGTSMPGCHLAQLGARRRVAHRERLEHAEDVVDVVAGRVTELADRQVQRGRERAAQPLVGAGLELAGAPVRRGPPPSAAR